MSKQRKPDWDPNAEDVLRDPRAAYDAMRERCPVAYSERMQWSVFRHEDVLRVLQDSKTFSNAVSERRSVPNGMDPPEHTAYRSIIEQYFTAERMAAFEPVCRQIAKDLARRRLRSGEVELMEGFALPFAARAQCAFLGWSAELQDPLIRWTRQNHAATLAQDREAMSELAMEFESLISALLAARLHDGANPKDDITTSLVHEQVWGRPLSHEEIASILRNWTVGEIGTLSAAIGILVHYLADHPDLQSQLREDSSLLPASIDEILRIHGPLIASRRIATRPVELCGRTIEAGERISLNWIAANRDGRVFDEPNSFRLDRDPALNLLYGAGLHVCPGAPLARLEIKLCMEEIIRWTRNLELVPERPAIIAVPPVSGYAELPILVQA